MRILICLLFSIVAVDFAAAACDINLRVKNETKYGISFSYTHTLIKGNRVPSTSDFQVKTRGVPWRSVDKGGWDMDDWANAGTSIESYYDDNAKLWREMRSGWYYVLESGKTAVGRYKARLGCGVKRRYRLRFTCHEVEQSPMNANLGFANRDVAHKTIYFPGAQQWTERQSVTIPVKSCE